MMFVSTAFGRACNKSRKAKKDKDNEKRTALEGQIKFRKTVLHQKYPEKKGIQPVKKYEGGRYVKLSLKELEHNIT